MSAQIATVAAGVSGMLGLLALLGYFFLNARRRSSERSIREIVEGEGLFNADQITTLLAQFGDDASRLEALQAIADVDLRKAEHLLARVRHDVDLTRLEHQNQTYHLAALRLTAGFFGLIAVAGLVYALVVPNAATLDNDVGNGGDPVLEKDSRGDSTAVATDRRLEVPLNADLSRRMRAAIPLDEGFLAALTAPDELVRLDRQGREVGAGVALTGHPTTLARIGNQFAVGLRGPGAVELRGTDLGRVGRFPVPDDPDPQQTWGEAPATTPASVAGVDGHVWINTEGDGEPMVRHLDPGSGAWTVPTYDGLGHGNSGWRLAASGERVWAITAETTPSTLTELKLPDVQAFNGHDHELVSCSTAIHAGTVGDLLLTNCDDELIEIDVDDRPRLVRVWGSVRTDRGGGWTHHEIVTSGDDFLVAVTSYAQNPFRALGTDLVEVRANGRSEIVFSREDAAVRFLAATDEIALIGLESTAGARSAHRILR